MMIGISEEHLEDLRVVILSKDIALPEYPPEELLATTGLGEDIAAYRTHNGGVSRCHDPTEELSRACEDGRRSRYGSEYRSGDICGGYCSCGDYTHGMHLGFSKIRIYYIHEI